MTNHLPKIEILYAVQETEKMQVLTEHCLLLWLEEKLSAAARDCCSLEKHSHPWQ